MEEGRTMTVPMSYGGRRYRARRAAGVCVNCQVPTTGPRCADCKRVEADRIKAARARKRRVGI